MQEILTGKVLIKFVKDNPNLSKMDSAREAGYMRETRNGNIVPDPDRFYAALLEAHGTPVGSARAGRAVSYEAHVNNNGALAVGAAYTKEFGVGPGDEFSIELQDDGIFLRLTGRVEGSPRPIVKPEPKAKPAAESVAGAGDGTVQAGAAESTEAALATA